MEELLQDVADEFGEAKLFRPNRDTRFSKDKTPVQDEHRRGDLPATAAGPCTCRCRPRGCTSAAAATTSSAPQLARAPRGDRRRPHRQGARARSPPTCARPRPTSPPTTSLKTAPARLLARPPPHRPAPPRTASSASGPTGPRAWLHTAKAKDRVVDGWHQLQPLNDWLAQHLTTSVRDHVACGEVAQTWDHRGARSRMACRVSMPKGRRARAGVVTPLST